MNNRTDLLILRARDGQATSRRALTHWVAAGLGCNHVYCYEAFGYLIMSTAALTMVVGECGGTRQVIEDGEWPDAPGFRLEMSSRKIKIEPDRYAIRPLYFSVTGGFGSVISTMPDLIAAVIGADVSAVALGERLLLGFNIDDASPYSGVNRVRSGESLVIDSTGDFVVCECDAANEEAREVVDERWTKNLAECIAGRFAQGFAMELSGGVDSRLALVLGISAGERPRLAFTVGSQDDADVVIARNVCGLLGIRHQCFSSASDSSHAAEDGFEFCRFSGFVASAGSYSWMPALYRRLEKEREGQVGGSGGECAESFYGLGLGRLSSVSIVFAQWIRSRLCCPSVALGIVFGARGSREIRQQLQQRVGRIFSKLSGDWDQKTAGFYLRERLRQWSGPVLAASSHWYRPYHPFLSSSYIGWGKSLGSSQRSGRLAQMELISRLDSRVGSLPYAGGRTPPTRSNAALRRLRSISQTTVKIMRRLASRRSKSDLGAEAVIGQLVRTPEVHEAMESLESVDGFHLDHDAIQSGTQQSRKYIHELGHIITAGWAGRHVKCLRKSFESL